MSEKKYQITEQKKSELEKDYKYLTEIKRKEVADKLDWYRENAEDEEDSSYSEALEQKEFLEHQIRELEIILASSEIIKNPDTVDVDLGNVVTLKSGSDTKEWMVVSKLEANPSEGKISDESPIGMAILGKKKGDKVKINTPEGEKEFEIVKIK